MRAIPANLRLALPKGWPNRIRSAVIHVISLAHFSVTFARSVAADSSNAVVERLILTMKDGCTRRIMVPCRWMVERPTKSISGSRPQASPDRRTAASCLISIPIRHCDGDVVQHAGSVWWGGSADLASLPTAAGRDSATHSAVFEPNLERSRWEFPS